MDQPFVDNSVVRKDASEPQRTLGSRLQADNTRGSEVLDSSPDDYHDLCYAKISSCNYQRNNCQVCLQSTQALHVNSIFNP